MKGLPEPQKQPMATKPKNRDLDRNVDEMLAAKRFERREDLPKTRLLNSYHPRLFENDVINFMQEFKRIEGRRIASRGEMVEFAFYSLREKLTAQPIPDWVTVFKKSE
jgi:hypothetical protein